MNQQKRGAVFFPNLDGLRFFAFLAVFLYHSFETKVDAIKAHSGYQWADWAFHHGYLGVNFFFVLSGFLITYLLLQEIRLNGRIDVPSFYVRRALRIWPLYYAMVGFGFLVFPAFKRAFGAVPQETASPLFYALFLGNFDILRSGMPDSSVLGVLWSLAVEEQFYLVWPLLLSVVPGKLFKPFFGVLILGSFVYRWTNAGRPDVLDYSTFSVASDLVVGAFTACLLHEGSAMVEWVRRASSAKVGLIYVTGFACIIFLLDWLGQFLAFQVFGRFLLSLFFAFVILEQNENLRFPIKMGKYSGISQLGRVSYGLYCLHFVGILIVLTLNRKLGFNGQWWQVVFLETALALGVTVALSLISYRFFESPFLRLKSKFSYLSTGEGEVRK